MRFTGPVPDVVSSMTNREDIPEIHTCLGSLGRGQGGWVARIEGSEAMVRRLMEMGLVEDAFVEVIHEAPFGKDPLAIRVRGGLLALRRQEAQNVTLRKVKRL